MKINNYVWENDLSLNDLALKQKEKIDELENQLQQKENIIKEVREFIEKYSIMYEHEVEPYKVVESEELLEILKGSDKE